MAVITLTETIIIESAEWAKEIAESIDKCSSMRILRLEGNTLGVDAAHVIAKALEKHPEFERARWSDMFTGRLKTEIPSALISLGAAIITAGAQLVELDLSDNAFGPTGVNGIVELLKSKSCYSLKELRLNNNGLGIGGGKLLAQSLLACHKSSSESGKPMALRTFISGRNRLENVGATALAEAFKAIGTLEEVAMPQNGINHAGITALSDALSFNSNLRILNLNDNTFTTTGAKSLSKALPMLQNLEVINLGDCLIRSEGAKSIATALIGAHMKLREVILCGNEINQSGAIAIAESMEDKECLEKLDLDANQLGEVGIELVQGTMEAMDMLGVLGSFSDDEGDEDDVEGEVGDEAGEEEGGDDVEEGEILEDPVLQVLGKTITPPRQVNVVSAKDFLSFPSPTKLINMGNQRTEAFKTELGNDRQDVDKAVQTVIRISAIVTQDDEKTAEAACECAEKVPWLFTGYFVFIDSILGDLLQGGGETNVALVSNAILVSIGLIKGEDKKFKPPTEITGPLLVLKHVVKQRYFPKLSKDILQTFLSKPHPLLEKSQQATHVLLQALYSY